MEATSVSACIHAPVGTSSELQERARAYLVGSELALLNGLQEGEPAAECAFFVRYERDVRRVLIRILGETPDVADVLHDTFLRAFNSASQVRDPQALRGWLLRVAASMAIDHVRRSQRFYWRHCASGTAIDIPVESASPELQAAVRDTYRVLKKLPNEERMVFALRHVNELTLTEIADACCVSLATIKRRLAKAEERFRAMARRQPELADWVSA